MKLNQCDRIIVNYNNVNIGYFYLFKQRYNDLYLFVMKSIQS